MEKDTCHGLGVWFMALRLRVDSSSDWPPDRNMIPGTAGGTLLLSILRVYSAMVSGEHLVPLSAPGVTMDGLSRIPSKRTSWSARNLKVWAQVLLATSKVVSMSCSPSSKIYGLARYAAIAQDNGLVPIVEPEILLDGEHDIDTTLEVASRTWAQTFKYLADQDVLFEGILLKPSMVTPGADSGTK